MGVLVIRALPTIWSRYWGLLIFGNSHMSYGFSLGFCRAYLCLLGHAWGGTIDLIVLVFPWGIVWVYILWWFTIAKHALAHTREEPAKHDFWYPSYIGYCNQKVRYLCVCGLWRPYRLVSFVWSGILSRMVESVCGHSMQNSTLSQTILKRLD